MTRNKKLGFLALLGMVYVATQKEQDDCPKYYNVDGKQVCETELPTMQYIYWDNGTDGSGWYHLTQFKNPFMPQTDPKYWEGIQTAAEASLYPNEPEYTFVQVLIDDYQGGGILA